MESKQKKTSDAQIKASNKYKNSHYKRVAIDLKPDDADFINDYSKEKNISKAILIIKSVRYIADNNIDLK